MKWVILTDHQAHQASNSVYAIARGLARHAGIEAVWLASRGWEANAGFFAGKTMDGLYARAAGTEIAFGSGFFQQPTQWLSLDEVDAILLRIPQPIPEGFFARLQQVFPVDRIINHPQGIMETSSKEFLLQLGAWTPEAALCEQLADIEAMRSQFDLVLKPLRAHGGKGLIRIQQGKVSYHDGRTASFAAFADQYEASPYPLLAMRYLHRVGEGDKRLVVANGEILSANLRLPQAGNWLCNIARGGKAMASVVAPEEQEMIEAIYPMLKAKGIFHCGFDTLVDDDGKRVLSEINTLSVGGLQSAEENQGPQVVDRFIRLLWDFIQEK